MSLIKYTFIAACALFIGYLGKRAFIHGVEVKCTPRGYYYIHITGARLNKYSEIQDYLPNMNITNWVMDENKAYILNIAKQFDTRDKVERWNDSVMSLVQPEKNIIKSAKCDETTTVY